MEPNKGIFLDVIEDESGNPAQNVGQSGRHVLLQAGLR